ncbi:MULTISPECIES: hypothetical protein [Weeksellaceae]|nr:MULTISPECIES: hypothetical protein [Weeksellaceae]MBG0512185.1 hypothetical protein [Elizabethkingia meningoseptica]MDE5435961.1 hypothetical protein [Elizabethkingia meningoseptica]MDX8575645.1 hypothetical protein [Elizabethkingia sp. HX WYD]HAY3553705.1 hypothetical protein [Elizabethkingia meningoseptica]
MKNKRIDFDSRFWSGNRKYSRIKLIESFFHFNDLVIAKAMLNNIMIYAGKRKTAINEDSSAIFHFHQALRSFVRACYAIRLKEWTWEMNSNPVNNSPLIQASLSDEEYLNPNLVFQNAFAEYSIRDFDYYIAIAVYFSMGIYAHAAESKIFAPYIHLTKMLDAAYLILERRIQKNQ